MTLKSGKGDALRKEKGVFAYFCRRMDKSKASGSTRTADLKVLFFVLRGNIRKLMASGGTRPAGSGFQQSNKGNRLTIC